MRLGWLFGEFASREFGLTWRQRHQISKLAHERFLPAGAFARSMVWIAIPVFALFAVMHVVLDRLGLKSQNEPFFLGLVLIWLFTWPWSAWVFSRAYGRPCRQAMAASGWNICVECGYCLDGLDPTQSPACPECGTLRTLGVQAGMNSPDLPENSKAADP